MHDAHLSISTSVANLGHGHGRVTVREGFCC
jgi:hypothetical protein